MVVCHPNSGWNASIKSGLNLPDTPCFAEQFNLKLCRKQTQEMKQKYRDYPNHYHYHYLTHHSPFDFLPSSSRKAEPISFYELTLRMVRLEIQPGCYETLVTNTDDSVEKLKDLYANCCKWLISHVTIKQSKAKKTYKINFSDAVYACQKFLRGILASSKLSTYIAKQLSIVRPNRTFPRKIKSQSPVSFTYGVP